MNSVQLFFKKHSSKILTVAGAVGVVGTTVLAVKATPKAMKLIEEAKKEQGVDKLTPIETIKVAWKPYIPSALTGIATITCIFGSEILNQKKQASMLAAYALLDRTFKDYRVKAIELYGEDADDTIEDEVAKSRFDKNMILHSDKELFYFSNGMRYYESTLEAFKKAEIEFNNYFQVTGYATIDNFFDILLSIDPEIGEKGRPQHGYYWGWSAPKGTRLKFEYSKLVLDDGLEAFYVEMPQAIPLDYISKDKYSDIYLGY